MTQGLSVNCFITEKYLKGEFFIFYKSSDSTCYHCICLSDNYIVIYIDILHPTNNTNSYYFCSVQKRRKEKKR